MEEITLLNVTMGFMKEHEFPQLFILFLDREETYTIFANTFDQLIKI